MALLAKIQPTIDTDPIPTAGANAILAGNFTINAIEAEFADRFNIQAYLGNAGKVQISQKTTCSFDVELASPGAAGTAPKFATLLRACAMAETLTASTSAVYNPISLSHEMATIYYYLDGILFKMLNAKGTVALNMDAGTIPKLTFTFTGSFSSPTDATMPTGLDYSGFKAPLGINKANTPTFTLHGATFKAKKFSCDLANSVVYRNLIGTESISITDRAPTGQTEFELESVATKDWYNIIRLGTQGAAQIVHGSVAGSIVQVDAPKVQLTNPAFGDDNGVATMSANLQFIPNTGNDELILTFK